MTLGIKRRLLAVTVLAVLAAAAAVPALANTVTLTNGAGCDAGDGAYGDSWVYADMESSYAHVKTHGTTASGCQIRRIDSAGIYYGGSWHYYGPSSYSTSDVTYWVSNQWASQAYGWHRICGAGPVCGSSTYTSD